MPLSRSIASAAPAAGENSRSTISTRLSECSSTKATVAASSRVLMQWRTARVIGTP
jgi:hypothetical protein